MKINIDNNEIKIFHKDHKYVYKFELLLMTKGYKAKYIYGFNPNFQGLLTVEQKYQVLIEKYENNKDCAVCLKKVEIITKLKCGHITHPGCKKDCKNKCPICQYKKMKFKSDGFNKEMNDFYKKKEDELKLEKNKIIELDN